MLVVYRYQSYELGSAQDLSLQCNFWPLHVGLVGALSFQYPLLDPSLKGSDLLDRPCFPTTCYN